MIQSPRSRRDKSAPTCAPMIAPIESAIARRNAVVKVPVRIWVAVPGKALIVRMNSDVALAL